MRIAVMLAAVTLASSASAQQRAPRPQPVQTVPDRTISNRDGPVETRESVHIVKPGETLSGVAVRAKVPRILIAEANRLDPPYRLHTGQRLTIPRTRHHTVVKGETGFGISLRYGVSWSAIRVANGIASGDAIRTGQDLLIPTIIDPEKPAEATVAAPPVLAAGPAPVTDTAAQKFEWPVRGAIVRGFVSRRERNYHDGIDLAAAFGTAVRAAGGGRVIFSGTEPRQFGQLVVIDHGNGWHSAYGHLSRITVRRGQRVRLNERIGLSGHSGLAKTDRVHFELRRANRPVDPVPLIGGTFQPSAQNAAPIVR